jgi:alkaline phosphatase D
MATDRRSVLKTMAAVAGAVVSGTAGARRLPGPRLTTDPFQLGVASGFPTDHSAVLWTRLMPAAGMPALPPLDWQVDYEVAADERFRRVAKRGRTIAPASLAHSVHAEVSGLSPDRDYWYRFTVGDYRSAVGRTRTLPAPHARVDSLRLAVACCQNYEHGHFAAFRHMANDAPDLIVHVGDYIYEGAATTGRVRQHSNGVCLTLDDYRQRYAQYKSDTALQAAHAVAPWLATWDDHEVANDYSGADSGRGEDPAIFLVRRAAAYQAYFEHMPLPPAAAPQGATLPLYARRRLGSLATIHLLDQRQYRSPQACPQPGRSGGNRLDDACGERVESQRTMLGAAQEHWLGQGLQENPARWTVLAQGTLFSHVDETPGAANNYWSDAWSGYPAARQRLVDALQQSRSGNPVILSGDLHAFAAGNINAVPERLESPLVASEFVASSISSDPRPQDSLDIWRANNANLLMLEGRERGYLNMSLTGQRLQVDVVAVDDVRQPQSGRKILRSFVVEAGDPRILPA